MRRLVLTLAGMALLAGGVYVLRPDSVEEVQVLPGPQADEEPRRWESLVVRLLDGRLGYVSPQNVLVDGGCLDEADGGRECEAAIETLYVVEEFSVCRRKVPDAGDDCSMGFGDGGTAELPYWLRLRLEDVVGADCQQVACAVVAGQDPDQPEENLVVEETP